MSEDDVFDPYNPPPLCKYCPNLIDDAFDRFTMKELSGLSCAFCGVVLIKNKTILTVIDRAIKEWAEEDND